nr:hypothetical protein GCM10020185_56680 [Pseudomonas brassicacearum subsp. brassicacearum]
MQMSFGGSSKQARSVIDGLPADVITMNMATDINALADNGKLVPENWVTRLPNNSAPFTSATVFIVRKGNPKALKDWPDLLKDGVQVIVPNPKTSGNGRYTYLSAWGYVLKNGGDENKAKDFVGKLFKQAPVLDTGGRAATTTFMTNQIGDVLVTFENEAEMIAREFGRDQFEVIYPSVSAEAEPPVSVVDKVVEKKRLPRSRRGLPQVPVVARRPGNRRRQLPAPTGSGGTGQIHRPLPESGLPVGGKKPSATGARCRRLTSMTVGFSTRSTAGNKRGQAVRDPVARGSVGAKLARDEKQRGASGTEVPVSRASLAPTQACPDHTSFAPSDPLATKIFPASLCVPSSTASMSDINHKPCSRAP